MVGALSIRAPSDLIGTCSSGTERRYTKLKGEGHCNRLLQVSALSLREEQQPLSPRQESRIHTRVSVVVLSPAHDGRTPYRIVSRVFFVHVLSGDTPAFGHPNRHHDVSRTPSIVRNGNCALCQISQNRIASSSRPLDPLLFCDFHYDLFNP